MQINYVIFDLGRTLILPYTTPEEITKKGILNVIKALKAKGFKLDEQIFFETFYSVRREFVERSLKELIQYTAEQAIIKVLQNFGIILPYNEIKDLTAEFFKPELEECYVPEKSAHEVLKYLKVKGKRLALLSNASDHDFILRITEKFGFDRYFDGIFSSALIGFLKPHEIAFKKVLEMWNHPPAKEVAMVGDSLEMDIKGAKNLGLVTIWIKRDEIEPDSLPDFTITNLGELRKLKIW
jgi:HAD superfamily hydrolase (TIGR01549 family)